MTQWRYGLGVTWRNGEKLGHRTFGPKLDVECMASLYVRDEAFYRWASSTGSAVRTEAEAIDYIKRTVGIDKLSQLTDDRAARTRFIKLVREPFLAWKLKGNHEQ